MNEEYLDVDVCLRFKKQAKWSSPDTVDLLFIYDERGFVFGCNDVPINAGDVYVLKTVKRVNRKNRELFVTNMTAALTAARQRLAELSGF